MAIDASFTLTANDIFSTLANMIISQQVFADNIGKHQTLVDKARVDGGLFGDRKIYYATNALASQPWDKDGAAANLLQLHRPADPKVQAIVLDQFRVIPLTVDYYLTKRAWSDEGSFAAFNSVMLGWMTETKKMFEGTLYNVYIGNTITSTGAQSKTVSLSGTNDGQTIAEFMANLLVELGDYSTDFNDYGFWRSYADGDIKVIWNSKYVNKIKKVDTPTIFHREGLVDKLDSDTLPAKYFGRAVAASDKGSGKVIGTDGVIDATKGSVRSKVEKEFTLAGVKKHYFPGSLLETGVQVGGSGHPDFAENEVYVEDGDVICKIVTKLPPFISSFEAGTNFFNPYSLTENHYLHFGYNTLQYLKNYPFITVKKA